MSSNPFGVFASTTEFFQGLLTAGEEMYRQGHRAPEKEGREVAGLKDAQEFTRQMTQYQCPCCKGRRWWGEKNVRQQCRKCRSQVPPLPLSQQVGIGWFKCDACKHRVFAGFARGDVASPCHKCGANLLPTYIVRGGNARGKKDSEYKHFCEACHGIPPCPIVEEAQQGSANYEADLSESSSEEGMGVRNAMAVAPARPRPCCHTAHTGSAVTVGPKVSPVAPTPTRDVVTVHPPVAAHVNARPQSAATTRNVMTVDRSMAATVNTRTQSPEETALGTDARRRDTAAHQHKQTQDDEQWCIVC